MNMTRRTLAAALLSSTALAGCQTATDSSIAVVAQDVALIANGLQGILPLIAGVTGIPASTVADVAQYIANLQSIASTLASTSTKAAALPLVQKVETYVNDIIGVLALLPLPPPIPTILQAAAILLPIIEAAVGMVVGKAVPQGMTPAQARLTLRSSGVRVKR